MTDTIDALEERRRKSQLIELIRFFRDRTREITGADEGVISIIFDKAAFTKLKGECIPLMRYLEREVPADYDNRGVLVLAGVICQEQSP